jgi:hypothetical protein
MPSTIDRTQIRKMAPALRNRVATGPCLFGSFDLVDLFDLVVTESTVHSLHNINMKTIAFIFIFLKIVSSSNTK